MNSSCIYRFIIFLGIVIISIALIFGFLFFEPFLTETHETITVINKEKWIGEKESYFIFTENEVFINKNDYYQNKRNADELYPLFKEGGVYKVKVVGFPIPFLHRFRNIIDIMDQKKNNVFLQ